MVTCNESVMTFWHRVTSQVHFLVDARGHRVCAYRLYGVLLLRSINQYYIGINYGRPAEGASNRS